MSLTPVIAPPEAQPSADKAGSVIDQSERLARPFRLGILGVGIALGLFVRLAASNGFGSLNSRPMTLAAAATSALAGLALLMISAERDRFGPPLAWISAVTALAWGALNWISPPFAESVTVWSRPDQVVLSVLGIGNGVLLAGLVALGFVRRSPTLSVAATMLAGVGALAANTIVLRNEWPAIILLGLAFALVLLAWDRAPRSERTFPIPKDSPRVSRAALSFISVALCGTAIQVWISRTSIPRSVPAVVVAALLIGAAFASLVRVRREIERRETTLSEWTSWMREIRTNDFRAEMENFESIRHSTRVEGAPPIGDLTAPPRRLSFPNLVVADASPEAETEANTADFDLGIADAIAGALPSTNAKPELRSIDDELASALDDLDRADAPSVAEAAPTSSGLIADTAPVRPPASLGLVADSAPASAPPREFAQTKRTAVEHMEATPSAAAAAPATPPTVAPVAPSIAGVFTAMSADSVLSTDVPLQPKIGDLTALAEWLVSPTATLRIQPLIVAVEAMALDEYESLPSEDAEMATDEIGSFLADIMGDADLVAWIDGPYFLIAYPAKPDGELLALNKAVRKNLRATAGTVAFLRPGAGASLDELVDEAVAGLLTARRLEDRAAGR